MTTDLSHLENLFLENDINEVRNLERKTRADIEAKKEELRQTVGEKYRGLMDSADVVKRMRNSAQKLTASVESISRLRGSWEVHVNRNQSLQANSSNPSNSPTGAPPTVCSVISTTETIWTLLSSGEYVQAVRLFTHNLELLTNSSGSETALQRGAARFSFQFYAVRESMVLACRAALRNDTIGAERDEIAGCCVYALMRLSACSLGVALQILLEERTVAVRNTFERARQEKSKRTDESVQAVASTLLQVVETVLSTVRQASAFACARDSTLKRLLETEGEKYEGARDSLALLASWFDATCETVSRGTVDWLAHVDTLPQLVSVRDAISARLHAKASEREQSDGESIELRYSDTLKLQLGKLLLQRATSTMDDAFERATLTLRSELERTLSDSPVSLADCVFTDSFTVNGEERPTRGSDVSADTDAEVASWLVASLERARFVALQLPVRAVAELNCKSRFYSLAIARFARALDTSVALALQHVNTWLAESDELDNSESKSLSGEPERAALSAHVATRTSQLVAAALASVARCVDETSARKGDDARPVATAMHGRLVLLARLCDAIVELCPSVRLAVSQPQQRVGGRPLKRTALLGTSTIDDARWIEVKAKVRTQQALIGRFWLRSALHDALGRFTAALDDDLRCRTQIMLIRFEAVEIVEECEDGRLLHSAIRVPHAASTYLHELLHVLASRWSAALAGALPRTVQLELLADAVRSISDIYRQSLERQLEEGEQSRKRSPLLQKQALQLWFDLNYLAAFLPRDAAASLIAAENSSAASASNSSTHTNVRQTIATLVKRIETLIDPIDMYVCANHVQRNLNSHLQRSLLLYAPLLTFATGYIMNEAAKLNRLTQSGAKTGTDGVNSASSSKLLDINSLALIAGPLQASISTASSAEASTNATVSSATHFEPVPLLATLLPQVSANVNSTSLHGKPFTAR